MISGPMIARQLSRYQIEYLLDHIDRKRPVIQGGLESRTRNALIDRELIQFDQNEFITRHAKATILTDLGHKVVSAILGDWADALNRWGYGYGLIVRNRETNEEYLNRYRAGHGDPGDGQFSDRQSCGPNERYGMLDVPIPVRLPDRIDEQVHKGGDHDGDDAAKTC